MSYYNLYNIPSTNASMPYMPQYTQYPMYQQPQVSPMQQVQPVQQVQQAPQLNNRVDFTGVIVNDFEEVKTYPVPLGGLTLLLNKKDRKFYLKSLNDSGLPIIETYTFDSITGDTKEESINIKELSKRLDDIEKRLRVGSKENRNESVR